MCGQTRKLQVLSLTSLCSDFTFLLLVLPYVQDKIGANKSYFYHGVTLHHVIDEDLSTQVSGVHSVSEGVTQRFYNYILVILAQIVKHCNVYY